MLQVYLAPDRGVLGLNEKIATIDAVLRERTAGKNEKMAGNRHLSSHCVQCRYSLCLRLFLMPVLDAVRQHPRLAHSSASAGMLCRCLGNPV
jgi:hypothetical protein